MVVIIFVLFSHTDYFDRRLRWWESKPRFTITKPIQILRGDDLVPAKLNDISEEGCFFSFADQADNLKVDINQQFSIFIKELSKEEPLIVKVVRVQDNGLGCLFLRSTKQKQQLKKMMSTLKHYGFERMDRAPDPLRQRCRVPGVG